MKGSNMSKFYLADPHFGHENSVKYDAREGGRSFSSVEERDKLIIENINKVVTPQDDLYLLGDVSYNNPQETAELIQQINCKNRFLILGNHDRWAKDGRCKKLFQGIYDIKQIEDDGEQLVLCHYPQMMWKGQHRGAIHLYGHVHNSLEEHDYQEFLKELDNKIKARDGDRYKPLKAFNVGCMLWDYKPITLKEIMKKNI
jgi:calcineurin-like phosphoesterase family protein